MHAPAADDCTTCHSQQGNAHRFTLAAAGADLCNTCHEVQKPTDKYVHGPVATGDCVACHDPHSTPAKKLVRAEGAALCESCHIEMKAAEAAHKYTHEPVKKDCSSCHSPHASPLKYQLVADGSALCFRCHIGIQEKTASSPVKHAAISAGRQCLNCHEPHVTDIRPQLRGATMTLCLSCHDREIPTPAGPLTNIKVWLDTNPEAHGPIQQKDCVACHKPHESEHFRLLREDFPPTFYSSFNTTNYQLCFTCHEPDMVKVEKTTTLTGFRDGDRNLHFLHVNRPEKGRTCRACHEVHSSVKLKHIREKVPFGSWALPIKFEAADGGGRCTPGCHVPQEYRRTKAAADATPRK